MPRFFLEEILPAAQSQVRLSGEDAHHVAHVLRMRPGQSLQLCDGAGTDLLCRVAQVSTQQVLLEILERSVNQTEPLYTATLYQGLVKGDKMDLIIQKAVELGASRIVPVQCQRSVVRHKEQDLERKQNRWNRIAVEAAKQCGRGMLPSVGRTSTFMACLGEAAMSDLAVIPWEMAREQSIRTVLQAFAARLPDRQQKGERPAKLSFSIIIGPEGGLTETEVSHAAASGIHPVSLGRRILRTETAGPAVLAMLLYQFDTF